MSFSDWVTDSFVKSFERLWGHFGHITQKEFKELFAIAQIKLLQKHIYLCKLFIGT